MQAERVWDGPRTKVAKFNDEHVMVQIGWWLEPERQFIPIMDELHITGSASPVYCEDDNE